MLKDTKEIIILALGTTRLQCPYDVETWSVNMGYQQIATDHGRIDKIIMVHGQTYSKEGNPYFNWDHFRELHGAGCDLINLHRIKGVPFRRYPLERVIKKLKLNYFSNTISYMIAYALYKYTKKDKETGRLVLKQPLKLRLYGVDMWEQGEYAQEKGGVECWLGYALGLGVEIMISSGSSLLIPVGGMPYGIQLPKGDYYNPLGLGKGKPLSPEEQKKKIEKLKLKNKRMRLPWARLRGEWSEGLHRESNPTNWDGKMPEVLW